MRPRRRRRLRRRARPCNRGRRRNRRCPCGSSSNTFQRTRAHGRCRRTATNIRIAHRPVDTKAIWPKVTRVYTRRLLHRRGDAETRAEPRALATIIWPYRWRGRRRGRMLHKPQIQTRGAPIAEVRYVNVIIAGWARFRPRARHRAAIHAELEVRVSTEHARIEIDLTEARCRNRQKHRARQ